MDFKTRRIRKEPRIKQPKLQKQPSSFVRESEAVEPEMAETSHSEEKHSAHSGARHKSSKFHLYTIGGGVVLLFVLVFGIYQVIRSLDFSSIVLSFGKPLLTDDFGNTNILLIGVGGEGHEGTDLTDTIIVASIDYDKQIIPMVSIPRDFYLEKGKYAQMRINAVYHTAKGEYGDKEGLYALRDTVTEITGLPIQYYVKVDFSGFKKIVDSIGGVDVVVENAIYDPSYPKGETIYYETFAIEAGPQHLDGETALKFARSRKTTSDFDRAKRQQVLLYAIKEKALSLNILTDSGKIKELYESIGNSIETNLSLAEILEMGKLAKDLKKENIVPIVMNDDPTACGGLVYTPAREYFSGASVLLPAGNNFDYTKYFVTTVLQNIEPIMAKDEIQVLNGTKTPGLAYEGMNILSRFCLNVVYYGNATNREMPTSTIYYEPGENGEEPSALKLIQTLITAETKAGIPPEYLENEKRSNAKIVVELGQDYLTSRMKDPFDTLRFFVPPSSSSSASTSSTTTTQQSNESADKAAKTKTDPSAKTDEKSNATTP